MQEHYLALAGAALGLTLGLALYTRAVILPLLRKLA